MGAGDTRMIPRSLPRISSLSGGALVGGAALKANDFAAIVNF